MNCTYFTNTQSENSVCRNKDCLVRELATDPAKPFDYLFDKMKTKKRRKKKYCKEIIVTVISVLIVLAESIEKVLLISQSTLTQHLR